MYAWFGGGVALTLILQKFISFPKAANEDAMHRKRGQSVLKE